MARMFAATARDGDTVDADFAVRSAEIRLARSGEPYGMFELADRTGAIRAIRFGMASPVRRVRVGEVVHVAGTVSSWRGERRIVVTSMTHAKDYRREDLVPVSARDTAELEGQLDYLIHEIEDPALRGLVLELVGAGEARARFIECPGSVSHHHAYLGGLLEHTVGVASVCRAVMESHHVVDEDLLLTAAILHDIGKVEELTWDTEIALTDAGRLVGHVVLGERLVRDALLQAGGAITQDIADRLSHVMISHHGELEWGSPKRPSTIEALVLHHADNLDAKVCGFMDAVAGVRRIDGRWSDAGNLFRRPLYAPQSVDDEIGQWDSAPGEYRHKAG